MANLPRPKVLPRVTYGPSGDVPNQMNVGGGVGTGQGGMSAGEAWDAQRAQAMGMMMPTQAGASMGPNAAAQNKPVVTYDPNPVAANYGLPPTQQPTSAPAPSGPNQADSEHIKSQAEEAMRLKGAVSNNRVNAQAAAAAGDNVNLARLNAEWQRLTQSPLFQQMYGGSDANAMKQRLVNVYMKPGNPAAANDLAGALSNAVADDVWAREATNAFGRPPNQLEWDEHWKAMNVGGRDPLEGHAQSIQNIKATMQGFSNNNQQTAYDDYSNWAGLGH